MEDNFDELLAHPEVASRWVAVTAELKSLAAAFDLDDLSEEDCRSVPEARIFAVSGADFDADKAMIEIEKLDTVKASKVERERAEAIRAGDEEALASIAHLRPAARIAAARAMGLDREPEKLVTKVSKDVLIRRAMTISDPAERLSFAREKGLL